jgi:hypothetical protein
VAALLPLSSSVFAGEGCVTIDDNDAASTAALALVLIGAEYIRPGCRGLLRCKVIVGVCQLERRRRCNVFEPTRNPRDGDEFRRWGCGPTKQTESKVQTVTVQLTYYIVVLLRKVCPWTSVTVCVW